jgi:signal peptidase I
MTAITVPPSMPIEVAGGKRKKTPTMGPVRANLEAFGVAILGAVLLKWFCLEAFQIPTSSMQPTLMGSSEAGIYDRLLVDKLLPALREPQRWDVTVFGYPLQQNQNYVKRLVGLPGEKLLIAGGNLYKVEEQDGKRTITPLRKPARIQEHLWKEVFPARQLVRGETQAIAARFLYASPGDRWTEADGAFTADLPGPSRPAWLAFDDEADGGFIDLVWDGYPLATAQKIRELAGSFGNEIVPDARIEARFTPDDSIEEVQFQVDVLRPGHDRLCFLLVVKGGKARLEVHGKDDSKAVLASNEKVCELPPGRATRLAFAHLDDMLYAWREGEQILELDTSAFDCREGCELPLPEPGNVGGVPQYNENQRVRPQLMIKGAGKLRVDGLRICRDLHYTTRGFDKARERLQKTGYIEVPAGHYFMMGDNTQQSVDSRGWTAIEFGVTADGTVIPPDEVGKTPGAYLLRGNKRVVPPSSAVDRDETPVVIEKQDKLAMIDEFGDVHALTARVSSAFLNLQPNSIPRADFAIERIGATSGTGDWLPPEAWVPFVPREHIRGRALVIFWRWPFPRLSPIK